MDSAHASELTLATHVATQFKRSRGKEAVNGVLQTGLRRTR
eukprot:CAMPEP_0170154898 /NCGR_PEP_ID=MMETSP0033_2-20121228/59193_1 /TAXON_ID=195969 /ORGANISM="Dolichomastix tenuilepis, Strain CCMP3274" /LENGTH=40 /DNA_ID= /DNA_START= /DNA_END= /DNA_ORIENTATION=